MLGIQGTGLYGRIRTLADAIRLDQQYLDNAPLGPIQKKRLQRSITAMRTKLKVVRAELRASKKKILPG